MIKNKTNSKKGNFGVECKQAMILFCFNMLKQYSKVILIKKKEVMK